MQPGTKIRNFAAVDGTRTVERSRGLPFPGVVPSEKNIQVLNGFILVAFPSAENETGPPGLKLFDSVRTPVTRTPENGPKADSPVHKRAARSSSLR